jgi:hypothetical protein
MITQKTALMFGLSLPFSILAANAAVVMPDFGNVPTGWSTDRYEPTSFSNVGTYQGRSDVLGIEITSAGNSANRPGGQQGAFYNTQGRQHALTGGAGSVLSADLFIPGSWADGAAGSIRTDMWGVMNQGAAVSAYPIIGFTNYGGAARLRVFDAEVSGGWVDLANTTFAYDAWTALSIELTQSAFVYSVNGSPVYTDSTINGSDSFSAVIMQAYNFADSSIPNATPVDYTAHWSNTASVPDGGTTLVLLGCALTGLGALRRKSVA